MKAAGTIRIRRPAAIFVDYDGTLARIVSRPSGARLSARTRRVLQALARQPDVRVAVVSGRALRDLRPWVRVPRVVYAGNHGLEIAGPGLAFRHPAAVRYRRVLRRLAARLTRVLRPVRGAYVEWKTLTFSIHWRAVAPGARRRFHMLTDQALSPAVQRWRLRVTTGKRIVEVRPPVDWDKGAAVRWVLARWSAGGRRFQAVYLGDDRTDEDGFRAVNRMGGYSILVGRSDQPTAARYRLAGPSDVHRWLTRFAASCRP